MLTVREWRFRNKRRGPYGTVHSRGDLPMMRKQGFTLVELLVVIAIISILASIVVPRVTDWISRGRMAAAVSEIRNADLALSKMLIDAERKSFGHFFEGGIFEVDRQCALFGNAQKFYEIIFYELLRRGKNADFDLNPLDGNDVPELRLTSSVKKKLGTSYLDLGVDPWGETAYQFYAGPIRTAGTRYRCYRGDDYYYNNVAKAAEDAVTRGNPSADDQAGYPAPRDLPVYIWCYGENLTNDQGFTGNGGDDINNWDNKTGWSDNESYQ